MFRTTNLLRICNMKLISLIGAFEVLLNIFSEIIVDIQTKQSIEFILIKIIENSFSQNNYYTFQHHIQIHSIFL